MPSRPSNQLQVELSFKTGEVILVYGEMDEDGFYMGELDGVRGLVPSNFLTDATTDQYNNSGNRPGGINNAANNNNTRGGVGGRIAGGVAGIIGGAMGQGARGPPPPPRDNMMNMGPTGLMNQQRGGQPMRKGMRSRNGS